MKTFSAASLSSLLGGIRDVLPCALCLLLTSPAILAQGITIVGPVVVGSNARQAPELRPMVDLSVLAILRPASDPSGLLAAHLGKTDSQGFFSVPPGHVVEQITTELDSDRCQVLRKINTGYPFDAFGPLPVVLDNPAATVDITQMRPALVWELLGNRGLTVEECSAYYNVRALAERAEQVVHPWFRDSWAVQKISVKFEPAMQAWGSPAQMLSNEEEHILSIFPVNGGSATTFDGHHAARSVTVLAHEIGHAVIRFGGVDGVAPSVHEAIADYIAFALTGEPRIGFGVLDPLHVFRDLRIWHRFDSQGPPHQGSLACSGALYEVSAPYGPIPVLGQQSVIDYLQRALWMGPNPSESRLLSNLLAVAPATHAQAVLCAFAERGMLSSSANPPGVSLRGCDIGRGFVMGGAPAPTLSPTYGASSVRLDVAGAASSSPCVLALSALPTQSLAIPGLPPLLLEPVSLTTAMGGFTSGSGQLSLTLSLPVGLPPSVLSAFVIDAAGPLGLTVTNGVYIGP
jgi:hypothetical protein